MKENNRIMFHLDDIRGKKNVTIKSLVDGICSDRQYRKYLSGVNSISDSRIAEFCNRLGISTRDFYYSFSKSDIYEFQIVRGIYQLITDSKLEEAYKAIKEVQGNEFSAHNQKYLDYCELRVEHVLKKDYNSEIFSKASKLINYPTCCTNDAFDFVDVLVLKLIADLEFPLRKTGALDTLINILQNDNLLYLSAETRNLIPFVYSSVANYLGKLRRHQDCIDVSKAGIAYCNEFSFSKSLTWLYYLLSMGQKHLLQHTESKKNAMLCFANVIAGQSEKDIKIFYNVLHKDFGIDPFTMFSTEKDLLLNTKDS